MAKQLCQVSSLPDGEARGFDLGEQRYIVLRSGSDIFVYRNRCPHLGVPLDWLPNQFMDPDGDLLRCATHGALFVPDTGECVSGPCLGQFLIPVPFERLNDSIHLPD